MTATEGHRKIGLHGVEILRVLFMLGCATARDLAGIADLPERTTGRQLGFLVDGGYVNRFKALPSWERSTGSSMSYVYLLSR